MVTFAIGGMTGVLLAIPGADFVLHSSLFVIAHFHNVIIGGAVFGYIAGFSFYFPKRSASSCTKAGARLHSGSGSRASSSPRSCRPCTGLHGHDPSSERHQPWWVPYLYVAMFGALMIAVGIACQLIQLYVSVRDRKQNICADRGDPWNGHAWNGRPRRHRRSTTSLSSTTTIDAFTEAKENGTAYQQPKHYEPIHMPSNTATGVVMGALLTVFGFASYDLAHLVAGNREPGGHHRLRFIVHAA